MANLKTIQTPLLPMICHSRHKHQNVKHDYLFGPSTFGGLEIPAFEITTNVHHWEMLRNHLEQDDPTKKILMASLGYSQLAVGSGTQVLSLLYKGYSHLVQDVFVKQVWHFLDSCKAKVYIPGLWIPSLQRNKDRFLMDIARDDGF